MSYDLSLFLNSPFFVSGTLEDLYEFYTVHMFLLLLIISSIHYISPILQLLAQK